MTFSEVGPGACASAGGPCGAGGQCEREAPLTPACHHPPPPGMPLIYWFSRRMTLWGSISFNLAVFINIIIAFFYPYMEGASTGGDTRLAD